MHVCAADRTDCMRKCIQSIWERLQATCSNGSGTFYTVRGCFCINERTGRMSTWTEIQICAARSLNIFRLWINPLQVNKWKQHNNVGCQFNWNADAKMGKTKLNSKRWKFVMWYVRMTDANSVCDTQATILTYVQQTLFGSVNTHTHSTHTVRQR